MTDIKASAFTAAANEAVLGRLDFANEEDFEFAARGFAGTLDDPVILREGGGGAAADLSAYDFLKGERPPEVNPSLWRQAKLLTMHGLFKVTDRIWQVRGFDVSVVTFILGETGFIVVDPLTTMEPARAALALARKHLGDLPVKAVIYSHTHADHFGGVRGVVPEGMEAGVTIVAPDGFMHHAVAENVIAGAAMSRRAHYQFGHKLRACACGEITSGLGPRVSRGHLTLIPPTDIVTYTGQEMVLDGVRFVFQVTPETEAPAEMNFHLPDWRALFMAENANATMHNVLTPRGALVRDAKAWADYLTESIRLYADKSDVMFAAHGIPRFGQAALTRFLKKHRDAYKFLHDQSVRRMNAGETGAELAETLELPDVLSREWYNRGYYGTMSHNSKAVYQRYMGWYDGNPASLWPYPPEESGLRYVDAMGGAGAVLKRAEAAMSVGDYRWAVQLLNHVVFADLADETIRTRLIEAYTQLGYQAEAGTWRNIYLMGALELSGKAPSLPGGGQTVSLDMIRATPTSMLLDLMAVRLDPAKAEGLHLVINLELTDFGERHLITVENGVLIHETGFADPDAGLSLACTRLDFLAAVMFGAAIDPKIESGAAKASGDASLLARFAGLLAAPKPDFAIVSP